MREKKESLVRKEHTKLREAREECKKHFNKEIDGLLLPEAIDPPSISWPRKGQQQWGSWRKEPANIQISPP